MSNIMAIKYDYEVEKPHKAEIIELFGTNSNKTKRTYKAYVSRAADSLRSLDDIVLIQNYFLNNKNYRDYMMFTLGICTGLRISDLVQLKVGDLINPDGTFRQYIDIIEKKTGKRSANLDDVCLITEAMQIAVSKYLTHKKSFSLDEPLIYSRKNGLYGEHTLDPRSGWRIMKKAQRDLELPYNIGSHTMRKTFANIAVCVGGESSIDMSKLLTVQHMLKHSDYKTTMRYLRLNSIFTERARNSVSDFVLGKTKYNDLSDALFTKNNSVSFINDLIESEIEEV